MEDNVKGTVFDIQRCSLHDGPGIRTTVFLKGCALRCRWCHNPESWAGAPQLSYNEARCTGCKACESCPNGAHGWHGGRHVFHRDLCTNCGACAGRCYARAIEMMGRVCTAREVMDTVMRDREFYEDTGGGVTISGGEPLCQIEFTHALLSLAKDAGLHTALDTSGYGSTEHLARVLPLADLFLFDLKADPESHEALTAVPIGGILSNLHWLAENRARIWLRVPVVPGVNNTSAHLEQICRIARTVPEIERIDLLPYHMLGSGKWGRIGLSAPTIPAESTHADAIISAWGETIRGTGVQVHIHSHPDKPLD